MTRRVAWRVSAFAALAAVAALWPPPAPAQAAEDPPAWIATWATPFKWTHSVDADSTGHVYVGDYQNWRVVKADRDGTMLHAWPVGYYPYGVSVNRSTDEIYVLKCYTATVRVFDTEGTLLREWGKYTYFPTQPGWFADAYDATVDDEGNVYVTDFNFWFAWGTKGSVQKFDANGQFVTWWGRSRGPGDGQFEHPSGIEFNRGNGRLYVADTGNNRIQVFDTSGRFLFKWGTLGPGPGQFAGPRGIATDGAGHVYVADTDNHRIQKFDGDGNFLTQWGSPGSGPGQFSRPHDVAVDDVGNIYVADTYNHRVQKFGPDADSDGSTDGDDNCPLDPNPGQEDLDGDGAGDVCDPDRDGDALDNDVDNCPDHSNPGQEDLDSDGAGDVCDPDGDGDGIPNEADVCPNEDPEGLDANEDGCRDRLLDLPAVIQALHLPAETEASLLDSVYAALDALARGQLQTALNQLGALVNKVEAQRGKVISALDADMLIQFVRNVA